MSLWHLWKGRGPEQYQTRTAAPGETLEAAAIRLYGSSRATRELARANAGRNGASVLEGSEQLWVPQPKLHRRWEDAWSETIRCPQDLVFDVLATRFFETCARWMYPQGTVRASSRAPVRAGSVGILDWDDERGRDASLSPVHWRVHLEVMVYEPARAFAWRASHGELGGHESYRFVLERETRGTNVLGCYKNETARLWNTYRRVNGYATPGLIPALRQLKALVESEYPGETPAPR